ncbi:MAG: hypothetical protein D6799_05335 [Bacteroidetes bacterium]|jgi:hypothetical protein|nr:MAG: hypothetical protein D6799_05335 [Bacteroidota bacterium]
MYAILKRFEERYGFLKKMGIGFEGIQMIDPIKKKHAIVLTRPFIFDCRLLPKKYEGIEVKVRIKGELPEEFKPKKASDYPFMPENFEKFVAKNLQTLRKHFQKPEMTKEELLDALAFGNFEEHKKNVQDILKEKQRKARLARAKSTIK